MPRMESVGSHKTMVKKDGNKLIVRYHDTNVVEVDYDSQRITLCHGGWITVMTKRRINQTANQYDLPFRLKQRNHDWYLIIYGITFQWLDDTDTVSFPLLPDNGTLADIEYYGYRGLTLVE